MNDRLRNALKRANRKLAAEEWVYGLVGKITPSGPIFDVPGLPNHIYVRYRNANGAQTTPPARNDPGVPHSAGLPVRMYYEGTTLVIDSVNRRPDLATVDPPPASGVLIHKHDERYFTEDEHINVSAGAADAGKPIVLDAGGQVDATMINIAPEISGASTDDTIVDADLWGYVTGGVLVKTAWSNIKATLKTYLDTLYVALTGDQTIAGIKTFTGQIIASATSFAPLIIERISANASAQAVAFRKSRGGTGVVSGDQLLRLMAFGELNTGAYAAASTAQDVITSEAMETFTATAQGRRLRFFVVTNGTIIPVAALTISDAGVVAIPGILSVIGNSGFGTSDIEAWEASFVAMQLGGASALMASRATEDTYLVSNAYYDGAWKRKISGLATQWNSANGVQLLAHGVTGAADSAISWVTDLRIAGDGGITLPSLVAKTTPVDADTMPLIDSAAASVIKATTWANIKNTLRASGDFYPRTKLLLVDPGFSGNDAYRFTTISAAMTAATAGTTIEVANATYTEDVTFSANTISLVGKGRPYFDGTDLQGGVIIIGRINCNGKLGATVKNLGVDIRSTAQVDAIISDDAVGTTAIYQHFENIIVIGKGASVTLDRGHGILCTTGGGNIVHGCIFHHWYHGVALRCSNSTVSDCQFYSCFGSTVIIKSDTGSGDALHCAVNNCVTIGTTGSVYDRAGSIKIESAHASFVTRYITINNITGKNTSDAFVYCAEVAGTVANVMVDNCVVVGGGDDPSRADFDVSGASDVHFTNCMSASRADGYGFRAAGGAVRVRAINCSSDSSGAGRVSNLDNFDYADFGSGLGTDFARIQNLTFDQQTNALAMRDSAVVNGNIATTAGAAADAITCLWTGNGNTTSLSIDLLITFQSGTIAKLYQYQIIIQRPNSSTLVAASQQLGATLATSGSGGGATVAVDVATANTAKIQFTGVTSPGTAAYTARITSLTTSSWTITAL